MKKLLQFLFFLSFICLITACQDTPLSSGESESNLTEAKDQELSNSMNGISIKMGKTQYRTSDKELTVNFKNDSNMNVSYTKGFTIQKKIDGNWYLIPFKDGYGVNEEAHYLEAGNTKSETYSLVMLSEKLSEGEYRIIQHFGATTLATTFEVGN